jgi:plastocyanin
VTRRSAIVLLVAALVAVGIAPGTAAARDPERASARVDSRVEAPRKTITIHIRDNSYSPANIAIEDGTTVRWINDGRNDHNVTAAKKSDYFESGNLKPGRSYVHRFSEPGTFGYYCTLHGTPTSGQHGALAVGDAGEATPVEPVGASDASAPSFTASGKTIRVPADAKTVQAGVDKAKPGDLVLVGPGIYKESVTISTDGVVLRGVDRNRTILDGEFKRENGVFVVGADGVAVENLTARNFTENGFFWNGVLGYRGSYLTAYRNGDYGIYAYDSQYGTFEHSYASGSPDSGFYIGQCNPCHAVITDIVAEYNQLGYSGSNASGDLYLVNSEWSRNRTGIVPNSFDGEELAPQGQATIAGNVVADNASADAAVSGTSAFDVAFGSGIVIAGGIGDVVTKNRVSDHPRIGLVLAPSVGLQDTPTPPTDNQVTDNVVERSGIADLALVVAPPDGNCFAGNTFTTSAPTAIEQAMPCSGTPSADPASGALDVGQFLDTSKNPKGRSYKDTPAPKRQKNMPRAGRARAVPAGEPAPVDLAAIQVPPGD